MGQDFLDIEYLYVMVTQNTLHTGFLKEYFKFVDDIRNLEKIKISQLTRAHRILSYHLT